MAEKRRDNKGRILRTGESQRKRRGDTHISTRTAPASPQFVYAWKLVATDKTPTGKRDDISLREKEAEINRGYCGRHRRCGQKNDCLPALRQAEQSAGGCEAGHQETAGVPDGTLAGMTLSAGKASMR